MFRLYCGLVRDGKWYNYAELVPLKGGTLAVLDGADKSGPGRMLNLIRGSVKALYTEPGEKLELEDDDYKELKYADGWKICLERMQEIGAEPFEEYFFCKVCSTPGNEKYTKVKTSWIDLISKGEIDEIFLEDPKLIKWETKLPIPIEVTGNKQINENIYDTVIREHLNLGQMISISKNAWANETEANLIYATWDSEIKSVVGMTDRELTILKRNPQENFCKKYIVDQENVTAMNDQPLIGLLADYRSVSCKNCNSEIGGHLDFTNFFSFLSPKTSTRKR